jgi:hypothetical protein
MKKILVLLLFILPEFLITTCIGANTLHNSGDLDVSQGWTITEYTPDFISDVNNVFLQEDESHGGTQRGVLVQAINIGDSTFTAQKVIHMKKGHKYVLDLIYAQLYTKGGTGYIDFNGEKIVATNDPSDHTYKKTITPATDMNYTIIASFISKYGGNEYMRVAYVTKSGGITDSLTTSPSSSTTTPSNSSTTTPPSSSTTTPSNSSTTTPPSSSTTTPSNSSTTTPPSSSTTTPPSSSTTTPLSSSTTTPPSSSTSTTTSPNSSTTSNSTLKSTVSKNKLPMTGDSSRTPFLIILLGIIIIAVGLIFLELKNKNRLL